MKLLLLGRMCYGSKMPVGGGERTIRTGSTKAVTVVGLFVVAGSVPTMVKLLPPAERLPVQWVTVGVAGAARFSRYRGVSVANLGVDVCAAAELVKPAQVNAISMAKVVTETKGPLRTKYLLI
jgi:hypothetical protein